MALIRWDGDASRVLNSYTPLAVCDETAAMRILEMPFLEDLDRRSSYALDVLRYMAETDVYGFRAILDHPAFQDGIASEDSVRVLLLFLKRENPSAATALEAFRWMEDVITPPAESDAVHQERYFEHFGYLMRR